MMKHVPGWSITRRHRSRFFVGGDESVVLSVGFFSGWVVSGVADEFGCSGA